MHACIVADHALACNEPFPGLRHAPITALHGHGMPLNRILKTYGCLCMAACMLISVDRSSRTDSLHKAITLRIVQIAVCAQTLEAQPDVQTIVKAARQTNQAGVSTAALHAADNSRQLPQLPDKCTKGL